MKHVPPPHGEPLTLSTTELRLFVKAEIERLLAVLDALDPDPDLEPSLGYSPTGSDDREGDGCDDEISGDENEPSLGSANPTIWAMAAPGRPSR